jgi:hypothetical protein
VISSPQPERAHTGNFGMRLVELHSGVHRPGGLRGPSESIFDLAGLIIFLG